MEGNSAFDKFIGIMASFAEIKVVAALRDGFIMTTPFTIVGSVFLLLANLPIPGYNEMMVAKFGYEWAAPLYAVFGGTFNILGVICCLAVAYKYTEAEGCNAIMASILAFSTFVIVMPSSVTVGSEGVANEVIPKLWTGSNGIISGMLIALFTSVVACYCEKNHIGIKMPPSVPGGVTRAFEALTPGAILFTAAAVVFGFCKFVGDTTFPQLLFDMIQSPLQGITDSVIGGTIFSLLQTILFWAGIHGPNVVGGVMNPIMLANALENQALIEQGVDLATDPRAHILTAQVFDVFMKPAGCGATIGLLISGWLFAKSEQVRAIIKLGTAPGVFNINEPIIFGLPIVFNPYMLVPFSLAMWAAMLITYFSISLGFMAPFGAVQVPWTTPPLLSGLLLQGIPGLIVQAVIVATSTVIYTPFLKAQDNAALKEEQEGAEN
jgi:PTS system cellobiose-specific IIC component